MNRVTESGVYTLLSGSLVVLIILVHLFALSLPVVSWGQETSSAPVTRTDLSTHNLTSTVDYTTNFPTGINSLLSTVAVNFTPAPASVETIKVFLRSRYQADTTYDTLLSSTQTVAGVTTSLTFNYVLGVPVTNLDQIRVTITNNTGSGTGKINVTVTDGLKSPGSHPVLYRDGNVLPESFGLGSSVYDIEAVGVCDGPGVCGRDGGEDIFPLVQEGTDDAFETTISVTDPTADRAITIPDAGGEVSLLGSQIENGELQNDSITAAGDSGSSAIALGGTLTIAGGTSITTAEAGGTVTVTNDAPEDLSDNNVDNLADVDTSADATDDQVMVGNGSVFQGKVIPDCSTAGTDKLLYDQATNAFSCGTDGGGGGEFQLGSSSDNSNTADFYMGPWAEQGTAGASDQIEGIIGEATTCEYLCARVDQNPGPAASGDKWTVTVFDDGVGAGIECDIVETAQSCCDSVNSHSFAEGSQIWVKFTETGINDATLGSAWAMTCTNNS